MELTVDDDAGFLGIVDPDAYEGFVAEDWTHESLFAHFAAQMARGALLLWATSPDGGSWTVALDGALAGAGARSVTGPITSRQGRLCLVDYGTLTMAAQFADVTVPEPHLADLELAVAPGTYACTVTQIHADDRHPPPHFALHLTPSHAALPPWPGPAWYDPASATFAPIS